MSTSASEFEVEVEVEDLTTVTTRTTYIDPRRRQYHRCTYTNSSYTNTNATEIISRAQTAHLSLPW